MKRLVQHDRFAVLPVKANYGGERASSALFC
jgi:hypothetical protein